VGGWETVARAAGISSADILTTAQAFDSQLPVLRR